MSEAKYWEEYDEAKKAALKMAAKLSAKDKGTMVRALHWGMIDQVRHDKTDQGSIDATMYSLDHPDDSGNMYDYGDCERSIRRIFRQMDAPAHEYFRELKLRRALYRLRRYPELQATLKAIYRHRFQPRQKIFSALKIRGETYRKRLSDLTQILKIST
jgi:hypothetical protein